MKPAATIDAYIAAQPEQNRRLLEQIRETIRTNAPGAVEAMAYGIPTYKVGKTNLIHFGGFATHVSLFPTSSGITAFRKDFASYKTAKGTVQFPLDQKLPLALIARVVKFRVKEVMEATEARHEK